MWGISLCIFFTLWLTGVDAELSLVVADCDLTTTWTRFLSLLLLLLMLAGCFLLAYRLWKHSRDALGIKKELATVGVGALCIAIFWLASNFLLFSDKVLTASRLGGWCILLAYSLPLYTTLYVPIVDSYKEYRASMALSTISGLQRYLSTANGVDSFANFLASYFASENIYFVAVVIELHDMLGISTEEVLNPPSPGDKPTVSTSPTEEDLISVIYLFTNILDMFIMEESPMCINISFRMRQKIEAEAKTLGFVKYDAGWRFMSTPGALLQHEEKVRVMGHIFDRAFKDVLVMIMDYSSRFCKSDFYTSSRMNSPSTRQMSSQRLSQLSTQTETSQFTTSNLGLIEISPRSSDNDGGGEPPI